MNLGLKLRRIADQNGGMNVVFLFGKKEELLIKGCSPIAACSKSAVEVCTMKPSKRSWVLLNAEKYRSGCLSLQQKCCLERQDLM